MKSLDPSQARVLTMLIEILDAKLPLPLEHFLDDSRWGCERTSRRTRQTLNAVWERLRGRPFFEIVDENGVPRQRGSQRFLKLADTSLTTSRVERMAVLPAFLQLLSLVKGTILSHSFTHTYTSWRQELSKKEKEYFDRTERKFFYFGKGLKDYSDQTDTLDEVYDSLIREQLLEIDFVKAKAKVTKLVRPLTLVMFNNGLYLVCLFDDQSDEDRPYTFKLETIIRAKNLKNRPFSYPMVYDPNRIFKGGFGFIHGDREPEQVVIEFPQGSWVERYLSERIWSDSDHFENVGESKVRFSMSVSDLREAKPWVLSLGSDVEVLRPLALREELRETARKLVERYGYANKNSGDLPPGGRQRV